VETTTGIDGRYRLGPLLGVIRLAVSAYDHGDATRTVDLGDHDLAVSVDVGRPAERREDFSLVAADSAIAGRVVDGSGFAARAATILVIGGVDGSASAIGRRTITNEEGAFSIGRLAAGVYRVRIEHSDFPSVEAQVSTAAPASLRLPYGGGVELVVRDRHTGAPLPSVAIVASGPVGGERSGQTDGDCAVTLVPIVAGAWTMRATLEGYVSATIEVVVPVGHRPREITVHDARLELERGAIVGGTVRDAWGNRVAGATVALGATTVRTNVDGVFRLRDVATGDVTLEAREGARRGTLAVSLRPGDELSTLLVTIE
jgi:hypothetical protein